MQRIHGELELAIDQVWQTTIGLAQGILNADKVVTRWMPQHIAGHQRTVAWMCDPDT